jgi:predicted ATPase/DNA-binding winged helix-turn-helix (wHTH) protein
MASPSSPRRYRFGSFELELDERRLLEGGVEIPLRPRAFSLLAALVDRAGHLITKDDLFDRVWPNMVVEETALRVQLSALRKILGADAIATVTGQGYRFALPVTQREAEAQRLSTSRHNLPHQLTSFIGREQEIVKLKALVTVNRLVTLTGAGGAGKTRLALELAGQLLDAFPAGVWFVELAALSNAQLVPKAIAQALGVNEHPSKSVIEVLHDYLASKRGLLVLDNAEHLIPGLAPLVDEIVRRSPDIAVLVTSRERLGIAGELTYRVPSLTVPGPNDTLAPAALSAFESVRLLLDRARLAHPEFVFTAEKAASVASICHRLDGIPLAIELAAPRLRSMSAQELCQRLDQRLALLTDGSLAAIPRHRTLRSLIDWSYDLLSGVEQAMLRRLSVFAGGWTLAAAEHVCGDHDTVQFHTLELLTSLADKNLLITEEHDGATRYRMLETVRQYALDRLREAGDEAQWRHRHFAWVLALAEESFQWLSGPRQGVWIDRMANELDNFRTALQWAIDQKLADALRMAPNLARWWARRASLSEARQWFTRLLDVVPRDCDARDRARALGAVGNIAISQGDHEEAERLCREADVLFRAGGHALGSAYVQTNIASSLVERGQYAAAQPLLVECIKLAQALGDDHLVAVNLGSLATAAFKLGDAARAASLIDEALTLARPVGDSFLLCETLSYKGRIECRNGELQSAKASFLESLAIARQLADPVAMIWALEGFAELALAKHAPRQAAAIWGAVAHLGDDAAVLPLSRGESVLSDVRATLGADAFELAWREGYAMTLDEAVRYALDGTAGHDDQAVHHRH